MRRVIGILGILLSIAPPSAHAFFNSLLMKDGPRNATMTVVQKTSTHAALSTLNLAYPANVTAGNLLIACAGTSSGSPSLNDDRGNTWVKDVDHEAGFATATCWHAANATGGATTVTVSGGSGFIVLTIMEVAGPLQDVDQVAGADGSGATVSISTPGNVSSRNEYMIAFALDWDHYATWTNGSGFTMQQLADTDGTGYITALQDKTVTDFSGQATATFGKNYVADTWLSLMVTFKAPRPSNIEPATLQSVTNYTVSGTSLTVTLPQPVGVGNLLVVCAYADDGGVQGIGDDKGNAWDVWYRHGNMGFGYALQTAQGATTVTLTPNTSPSRMAMTVIEVSGGLKQVDYSDANGGNNASQTVSTSGALTSSREYVVGCVGNYYDGPDYATFTPSAGYTVRGLGGPGGGPYLTGVFDLDRRTGLSGVQSLTMTESMSAYWMLYILTFK